jgi:WD40 repeat protein
VLQGHRDQVSCLAFHPAGKLLASGSHDFNIRTWTVASSKEKLVLKGHKGPIMSLAYNPDGELLASACMDRTLRLWDPSTGSFHSALKQQRMAVHLFIIA